MAGHLIRPFCISVPRFMLGLPDLTAGPAGFRPAARTDGLRFRATDQDWAHGQGPEVTGPSEALAWPSGAVRWPWTTWPGQD